MTHEDGFPGYHIQVLNTVCSAEFQFAFFDQFLKKRNIFRHLFGITFQNGCLFDSECETGIATIQFQFQLDLFFADFIIIIIIAAPHQVIVMDYDKRNCIILFCFCFGCGCGFFRVGDFSYVIAGMTATFNIVIFHQSLQCILNNRW